MRLISKNPLKILNLRFFSSIFEVLRQKSAKKEEILTKNCILRPNVKIILKRYSSIDTLNSNTTFNEFIKNVEHLRSLNMDALYHLPYYKCEDISSIIKFLSRVKYRDIIVLQGLCEALYWQCNINKARLMSITSVLSNLANLYYVPHYRICRKFIDEMDNPKNKQTIGDYVKVYKFLSLTSLSDSNYFVPIYERIESKCLNSMGLMNHSQLSLLSTILLNYPGGKWELMSKICDNFQRKLHETSINYFIRLLRNVNKLKIEFKLPPRHYIPLLTQIVNNNTLSNKDLLNILKTMSIYYIRDMPLLSKLGNLLSERNDLTINQQIVALNIFSQLCYKHKEFLLSRPLDSIINGLNKYKSMEGCRTIEEIKELFLDFYPYISVPPNKFVEYSIAYINCLAKVGYNKRSHIKKSLEIIFLSERMLQHFPIREPRFPTPSWAEWRLGIKEGAGYSEERDIEVGVRTVSEEGAGWRGSCGSSDTGEIVRVLTAVLPQNELALDPAPSNRLIDKFSYSKSGLVRIDRSVKELLHSKVISDVKPSVMNIVKRPQGSSQFDSLEAFKESIRTKTKDSKRLEVPLPENCIVYRTKTALELHTNFLNRAFGEYASHPAHKRLYNRKLYRKMIKIVFKKRFKGKNELKAYTPSKLYNTSVFLETSSGIRDEDKIRKIFLKRKRYSGNPRAFESNLNYTNKWRLLRRCFLRPYLNLYQAFNSSMLSKNPYINRIVECYKNPNLLNSSLDSFVDNKSKFIYDTKTILEMDGRHVKMGKTIKEFRRIRDSYMNIWKNEVDQILANQPYSLEAPRCNVKISREKRYTNILVRGLESLIKLRYFSAGYLKYVLNEIETNIEDKEERKIFLDRVRSITTNLNLYLLDESKKWSPLEISMTSCSEPNVVYTQPP